MLGFSSYFSIPPALTEENVSPGQKGGVGLPSLTRCPLDAVYDTQHLHLILRIESVAAFNLHRESAVGHHLADPFHRLGVEIVLRGPVQQVGRVEDSAPTSRYLLVAQAVDLVEKLPFPASGVHDMRVAVAKRRHHHSAFRVDDVGDFSARFAWSK